jgi:hypothetical protein
MGNFLPKKTVAAGGGGVSVTGQWVAVGSGGLIAKSTDGNVWTPYTNSHWLGGQNEKNLVDYHPMEYPKATGFEKLPFQGRAITGRWEATGDYNN